MRAALCDDRTRAGERFPGDKDDLDLFLAIRTHYPDTAVPAAGAGFGRTGNPFSALTPRETEVLRRIAAGQNTATMVREMAVTTATLRTYVKNVLAKLGAHSRLEAAALASRWVVPEPDRPARDDVPITRLTPREREVLYHFTAGTSLREVAGHLHMAQKTVNTHLQKIRSKLGVHSTLEAVALARSQLAYAARADD
jgi:DNA-binding CsgD family transcriptional regulator